MYSGILSLNKTYETVQIGWVGEIADQDGYIVPSKNLTEKHKQNLKDKLWEKGKVVPIFLEDNRAIGHYEGYCKTGKTFFLYGAVVPAHEGWFIH
jgi:trehalose 6-phosphate synthase/phosphatase